jgi:hypothetical protein
VEAPESPLPAQIQEALGELSSRGWRGVVMTPRSVAEIERRRRQPTTSTEEVAAA